MDSSARSRLDAELDSIRAQGLYKEILASVKGAPGYYRSRQREWTGIAKSHLK